MERGMVWRRVAIALVCVGIVVAIGAGAYHFGLTQGFAHGLAEGGRALVEQPNGAVTAPPGAMPAYPYGWGYGGPHYWGHGFFFFPFFSILLLFLLLRFIFWRGPWHRGWHHRYDGVPPRFEEWHRRLHEQQGSNGNETDPGRGR
jgi:hypothetical protein